MITRAISGGQDPAYRYDPPIRRELWQVEADFPKAELAARLGDKFPELTRDLVKRIFWHGGFYLNQKRTSETALPPTIAAGSKIEIYRFLREPEEIPIDERHILWDEGGILAVDKPAWLPTQSTRVSARFSLEEALRKWLKNPRIMAIHRLDRQTSGVVLFSKTPEAHASLSRQFEARAVHKEYLAVVSPVPKDEEWKVQGYLSRDRNRMPQVYYRLRARKSKDADFSETDFRRVGVKGETALVEAYPLTGRTHQIRVHLAAGGTPVAGDTLYGKPAFPAPRIQLHSHRIAFLVEGPMGGERSVSSPWPGDFLWSY